jgi:hypothetical protein
MSFLEISFVLVMLLAGLWVILIFRREFGEREEIRREEQRQLEQTDRRQRALSRSYQPPRH